MQHKCTRKTLKAGHTVDDTRVSDLRTKTTALATHCIDHNHRFDLETVKILDQTRKTTSLPILEMINFFNEPLSIN